MNIGFSINNSNTVVSHITSIYSQNTFFVVVLGAVMYSLVLAVYSAHLHSDRQLSLVGWIAAGIPQALLLTGLGCISFVWINKTRKEVPRISLERIQALCPVLIMISLSLQVFTEIMYGSQDMNETLLAESGLKMFPIIFVMSIRDTRYSSLLVGWMISVFTLLTVTVYLQSIERFSCIMAYTISSAMTFYECYRQANETEILINQLKTALEENERLAVEAQALELRAMIGNIAHDLKTVSKKVTIRFIICCIFYCVCYFYSVAVNFTAEWY